MKKETVEKANKIIAEIKQCKEHIESLNDIKAVSEQYDKDNGADNGGLSIFVKNHRGLSERLLLVNEPEILDTAIAKSEKYLRKKEQEFEKLKDE